MSKKITCTRCLGKGFIDKKDIKRLGRGFNRVSEWEENSDCKFCKGEGTITEKFASKHNPDSGEFPNVVDNSGLVDFLELTNEEKNKQYTEFKEKFGDKVLNPDEDENKELENNLQPKTIFWTAFVSIVLTLSVVLFFSGELNNHFENEMKGDSDFSNYFKGLSLILFGLFVPATIIYRLMFGKIDRDHQDLGLYILFVLFSFVIFWAASIDIAVYCLNIPRVFTLDFICLIISFFITRVFLKWMYIPISNQNKKNSL